MLRHSWSFRTFLCILGLESSHLWLLMKEEKSNQERGRREPARWNKARTCSLVWNVIHLNLLWDSRTGCVCVCVCMCGVVQSVCVHFSLWICLCMWRVAVTHPTFPHPSDRHCFFGWGDIRPTWIYLQRNLYELWWTCLDQQSQTAQQRASIKTLTNCISKRGEAKVDRQCWSSP